MATATPNWVNIIYESQSGAFKFVLRNPDTFYEGLAYPYPDGTVRINVMELYNSYFKPSRVFDYPTEGVIWETSRYTSDYTPLSLYKVEGENEELLDSWNILNGDFDYETSSITEDCYLSQPINGRADPRMFIYATQFKPEND